jgi:hypothetical protein
MANTFITVDQLARDGALLLDDRLRLAKACSREVEEKFAAKLGDTVKVQVPAVLTAGEFSGSTSAQNLAQLSVPVQIEKHFYTRVDLTSAERTLKLDDFNRQVTMPAINALQDQIEQYLLLRAHRFQHFSGTGGTDPSTVAHIVAGRKVLQDAKVKGRYVAVINTTTEQNLLQLQMFQSKDYSSGNENALAEGELGRRFGIDWLVSPHASGFARGDVAGTVLAAGAATAGAVLLAVDGLTAATGTIYAGTHFTVAGSSTVHVVTADATIASNAATLSIYPALSANVADNAAVTFKAAATDNFLMVRGSMAAAIIPPAPLAVGSSIYRGPGGLGIRVTGGTSTSSLSDSIVFDVMVGAEPVHKYAGAVWNA